MFCFGFVVKAVSRVILEIGLIPYLGHDLIHTS